MDYSQQVLPNVFSETQQGNIVYCQYDGLPVRRFGPRCGLPGGKGRSLATQLFRSRSERATNVRRTSSPSLPSKLRLGWRQGALASHEAIPLAKRVGYQRTTDF
ncbi:MAG: hypothetical protein U1A77_11435 [Pirellulales bacterium]